MMTICCKQLANRSPTDQIITSTILRTWVWTDDIDLSNGSAKTPLLVDRQMNESHESIEIQGKRGSTVLFSEHDWRAIQETLI